MASGWRQRLPSPARNQQAKRRWLSVRCKAWSASLHLNAWKSPTTRVPESKNLQGAIRYSVVKVVVHSVEGHTA